MRTVEKADIHDLVPLFQLQWAWRLVPLMLSLSQHVVAVWSHVNFVCADASYDWVGGTLNARFRPVDLNVCTKMQPLLIRISDECLERDVCCGAGVGHGRSIGA